MDQLLAWYNLIFYIPMAAGLLMALGMALGVAEVPHGVDIDGDGHPDVAGDGHGDHGHEATHFSPLALLGFGRVPALLVVMTMMLTFGGAGVIANMILDVKAGAAILPSLGIALAIMITTTSIGSRLLAKVMPTLETKTVGTAQIIGCTGTLITSASIGSNGVAQVHRSGELFQIACKALEPLPKGQAILVTDYDPETKVYDICPDPMTAGG